MGPRYFRNRRTIRSRPSQIHQSCHESNQLSRQEHHQSPDPVGSDAVSAGSLAAGRVRRRRAHGLDPARVHDHHGHFGALELHTELHTEHMQSRLRMYSVSGARARSSSFSQQAHLGSRVARRHGLVVPRRPRQTAQSGSHEHNFGRCISLDQSRDECSDRLERPDDIDVQSLQEVTRSRLVIFERVQESSPAGAHACVNDEAVVGRQLGCERLFGEGQCTDVSAVGREASARAAETYLEGGQVGKVDLE